MTPITDLPLNLQSFVTITSMMAAVVVLWASVCALNFMSSKTRFLVRLAHVLIGTGAAAMILAPVYIGHQPGVGGTVMATGIATLLVVEQGRARRALQRYQYGRRKSDLH